MSDERLKKVLGEGRENRAMQDRVVMEDRETSDDARLEMFRQQFFRPRCLICRRFRVITLAG